jgi:hypothetical protein
MDGQARSGEDRGQPRERVTLGQRLAQRLAQPLDREPLGIGARGSGAATGKAARVRVRASKSGARGFLLPERRYGVFIQRSPEGSGSLYTILIQQLES